MVIIAIFNDISMLSIAPEIQKQWYICCFSYSFVHMMTSSNGNIFRVTGPLCGAFTGPGEFPTQRPVTRSFDVFFDLRLNKRLSKQSWGWWFETLSRPLWRHRSEFCIYSEAVRAWKRLRIPNPFMRGISQPLVDSTDEGPTMRCWYPNKV